MPHVDSRAVISLEDKKEWWTSAFLGREKGGCNKEPAVHVLCIFPPPHRWGGPWRGSAFFLFLRRQRDVCLCTWRGKSDSVCSKVGSVYIVSLCVCSYSCFLQTGLWWACLAVSLLSTFPQGEIAKPPTRHTSSQSVCGLTNSPDPPVGKASHSLPPF